MVRITWTKLELKPDPKYGSPCERSSHGLSVLKNGTLLFLYGGERVARTPLPDDQVCWIGDLRENQWIAIGPVVRQDPPERVAHAQAVHQDSTIYVFGGRAGINMDEKPLNDLWAFDIDKREWIEVKSRDGEPPEPRSFHRMVCARDALYVFGGCGANGRLADLHKFDLNLKVWSQLPSSNLRGRGGANLLTAASGTKLLVVAGFCGEETSDGQVFDIHLGKWEPCHPLCDMLSGLRPRSVCVSGSFPSLGISLLFGGEVDPSERGHEGAGGFANDLVVLDERTGALVETLLPSSSGEWPTPPRGWSDGCTLVVSTDQVDSQSCCLFVYGGLSGDDQDPIRLGDLWRLDATVA